MWKVDKDKFSWQVPPTSCTMKPLPGDEQVCKSEEEYKAFVAKYME